MALSYNSLVSSGSSNASASVSEFIVNITDGTKDTVILEAQKPAGNYVFAKGIQDDLTIYLGTANNEFAGQVSSSSSSSTGSITATAAFDRMVIVGATQGNVLTFNKKEISVVSEKDTANYGPPRIYSVSPSTLESVNDSVVITGGNFANNFSVAFFGTDGLNRPAKSATKNSLNQITAVRPDSLPVAYEPYDVIVTNTGISPAWTLADSIDAGTGPSFNTAQGSLSDMRVGNAYSYQLSATDPDGYAVSYSVSSGGLPPGLSLSSSGLISGTPTAGGTYTFVVQITDSGNNTATRSFSIDDSAPTWNTSSLPSGEQGLSYSTTLSASDQGETLSYSIVSGSLQPGLSLNSSTGSITGTPTSNSTNSITFRATDQAGNYTDRTLSLYIAPASGGAVFTTLGDRTWTVPTGVTSISILTVGAGGYHVQGSTSSYNSAGGGGALSYVNQISVTPGETLYITVPDGSVAGPKSPASVSRNNYYPSGSTLCAAESGNSYVGGAVLVGTGFSGQEGSSGIGGGGAAGGYTGAPPSNGGSAGSGGAGTSYNVSTASYNYSYRSGGAGAGGIGIYGVGSNGVTGANATSGGDTVATPAIGGTGGSGGETGGNTSNVTGANGAHFGGGGGGGGRRIRTTITTAAVLTTYYGSGTGGNGAVRIIWGTGRAFPGTNVAAFNSIQGETIY